MYNNICGENKTDIVNLAKKLENASEEMRSVIIGFLLGAEYTEAALKNANKSA